MTSMLTVPFFRPSVTQAEIDEVADTLRSGWLTTGPKTRLFETEFAAYVGAQHAVAVNSCTAALHLALEAVGLKRGELVLVPTMTFAATAEVVRYFDAIPVLVDCDAESLCMSVEAARATLVALRSGKPVAGLNPPYGKVRALIPMHYGGQMVDVDGMRALASEYDLALIEDAAHTLPAGYRRDASSPWRRAGTTGDVTCFSFYANKCITTGEGGMAVTDDDTLAERMRIMSLHGISKDAWKRYTAAGSWYYEIIAPGFKYNLTDVAAAIGIHQLRRADDLWAERRAVVERYQRALGDLDAIELPREAPNRQHAWHLFPVRLRVGAWKIDRAQVIDELKARGISTSVHWMPLHLHPYYRDAFGYRPGLFPVAESIWPRLISLPIFPGMREDEIDAVVAGLRAIAGMQTTAGQG
ncbi:MAG: DegT/DnrJ/EryC1/StrS family aminotransferase [Myxococcota bacterium]